MYYQTNPTELFRERQLMLLEETENRRLARQQRARRAPKEDPLMRCTLFPFSSKRSLALLGAMLLALIVLGLGASANKAEAATTVTKTFSNSGQVLIPSGAVLGNCASGVTKGVAAPYPSTVFSSGFRRGSRIVDVNLKLNNFSHTFPDDVDVLLIHETSRDARNRTVMSDGGGSADVSNITLTLDDEARFNNFMPDNGPLVTDTYFPTNYEGFDIFPAPAPTEDPSPELFGFDGQKANGSWKLFVLDDSGADCGKIGGWSVTIQATQ